MCIYISLFFCSGISVASVERIIKQVKTAELTGEVAFISPKKKRTRKSPVTDVPAYQLFDIRDMIYNFHKTEGLQLSLRRLQMKIKDEIDWNGCRESLRMVVRKMGFRWRKTKNNRKVLMEKPEIRALRIDYLKKITYFRSIGRPIIYLDETYIHSGHTNPKSWDDGTNNGLLTNISKGNRLIIVHAGGETGFVQNALLIFKSGTKSGDYHDDMNGTNYEKWLREKLIPNLPHNSVIVTDNAPYHNVLSDPAPTSNSKKADMVQWLIRKNLPFDSGMLKPQLYDIIKRNKKRFIKYKFDEVLNSAGHDVLRLPPYHPTLNAIEEIWGLVKNRVASRNVTFKLDDVKRLAEEEFEKVTAEDWQKRCRRVIENEKQFLEREHFYDEISETNELIINLADDSDSDDYNSDSDEDDFD